ncbi:MAG: mechanosensitive ion channel family protein [Pseudomonadota bacterium]
MISSIIPWDVLIYIALLVGYIVVAKKIRWLPEIPLSLFICHASLIFLKRLFAEYPWGTEWLHYIDIWSIVFLVWGVAQVIFWLFMTILSRVKNEDDVPPKITRDFILFITFIILFLLVLRARSDVNLASLLTTSAVITVVIGLAVQATLNNFFSGLIIQAERLFTIGDWIEFDGKEGRVTGISWKSTQLLTREQVLIYIPNSILASSTFSNFSRPTKKKVAQIYIGLEYGVPYNKVKQVITQVTDQHPRVLKIPRVNVRLLEYGDFAIIYEIRVWHTSYAYEPQLKADIYQQLWYALRRNNIRIPFPIRDVFHGHVERKHEKMQTLSLKAQAREMMEQVPILSPLSDEELTELSQNVSIHLYGADEPIVQEGDDGDSMYIIRSGACNAMKIGESGRLELLSTMHPGDFFGEISLLTGEKRTATIKATQDTSVIVIKKGVFSKIISANPIVSEQIATVVLERRQKKGVAIHDCIQINENSKKFIETIKTFFGI